MSARGKARKRALDILFESEIRGEPVLDLLAERSESASPPVPAYAAELVRGVQEHREQIDELLAGNARGWTLERDPSLLETNIPGIFAVGDVRYGSVKRVASGVGEGSVAIQFVHQYLSNVS